MHENNSNFETPLAEIEIAQIIQKSAAAIGEICLNPRTLRDPADAIYSSNLGRVLAGQEEELQPISIEEVTTEFVNLILEERGQRLTTSALKLNYYLLLLILKTQDLNDENNYMEFNDFLFWLGNAGLRLNEVTPEQANIYLTIVETTFQELQVLEDTNKAPQGGLIGASRFNLLTSAFRVATAANNPEVESRLLRLLDSKVVNKFLDTTEHTYSILDTARGIEKADDRGREALNLALPIWEKLIAKYGEQWPVIALGVLSERISEAEDEVTRAVKDLMTSHILPNIQEITKHPQGAHQSMRAVKTLLEQTESAEIQKIAAEYLDATIAALPEGPIGTIWGLHPNTVQAAGWETDVVQVAYYLGGTDRVATVIKELNFKNIGIQPKVLINHVIPWFVADDNSETFLKIVLDNIEGVAGSTDTLYFATALVEFACTQPEPFRTQIVFKTLSEIVNLEMRNKVIVRDLREFATTTLQVLESISDHDAIEGLLRIIMFNQIKVVLERDGARLANALSIVATTKQVGLSVLIDLNTIKNRDSSTYPRTKEKFLKEYSYIIRGLQTTKELEGILWNLTSFLGITEDDL